MFYLEKEKDGEFFNPVSSTVAIDSGNLGGSSSCPCPPTPPTDEEKENKDRWSWLINGWKNMTLKEKLALFGPYTHFILPRDDYKKDFDEVINRDIAETSYKLCRDVAEIKFYPDRYGIPNILVVFKTIDVERIPDANIKSEVRAWGRKYGFLSYDLPSNVMVMDHDCCCKD